MKKAGRIRIIAGICIFLTGTVIIPLGIILSLIFNDSNEKQFKVPSSTQYTIGEPGRYYLWNEYQIIFEGLSYNRSESIPDGMQITIHNRATGERYNFISDTSISSSGGSNAKNSVGYIEVQYPGNILIEIAGGNEERIFSFSQFRLWKIFGSIFGGIGLAILICLAGGGLIVWGIIAMSTSSTANKKEMNEKTG